MAGGGYFGNKYFPGGYFPENYFGNQGETDPNAMRGVAAGIAAVSGTLTALNDGALIGSAAGVATVTGVLTFTGEIDTPVAVEPVVLGGAARSRRTPDPVPSWRGAIREIRADVVGSCIVTAEIVRHGTPSMTAVSRDEIEDDDLEVMAFISAFLAKVANVDRIDGISF
jgi:hypothetical protein